MDPRTHEVADLILAIEAEMRRLDLWEEAVPPPEALASQMPFSYDTLEFTQWLQWMFIPRIKQLLEAGDELPCRSEIHPLAEHTFKGMSINAPGLLYLIKRFDDILCEEINTLEAP